MRGPESRPPSHTPFATGPVFVSPGTRARPTKTECKGLLSFDSRNGLQRQRGRSFYGVEKAGLPYRRRARGTKKGHTREDRDRRPDSERSLSPTEIPRPYPDPSRPDTGTGRGRARPRWGYVHQCTNCALSMDCVTKEVVEYQHDRRDLACGSGLGQLFLKMRLKPLFWCPWGQIESDVCPTDLSAVPGVPPRDTGSWERRRYREKRVNRPVPKYTPKSYRLRGEVVRELVDRLCRGHGRNPRTGHPGCEPRRRGRTEYGPREPTEPREPRGSGWSPAKVRYRVHRRETSLLPLDARLGEISAVQMDGVTPPLTPGLQVTPGFLPTRSLPGSGVVGRHARPEGPPVRWGTHDVPGGRGVL